MSRKQIELDKENERRANALSKEAGVLSDKKDYRGAAELYTEAISYQPTAKLYFLRGSCYKNAMDYDRAILDFTVAIENSEKAAYYLQRGICFRMIKLLSKSLADLDRGLEIEKDNGQIYLNRGLTLYDMNKKEEAIVNYTKSIELTKSSRQLLFKPYFHRGNTLRECGKLEESIDDLSKAVEIDPKFCILLFLFLTLFTYFL